MLNFAHGMVMKLEYAQIIMLLYILEKRKMRTGHEESKVRKHVGHVFRRERKEKKMTEFCLLWDRDIF